MQALENYLLDFLNRDLGQFLLPGLILFLSIIVLCRLFLFALSKVFQATFDWFEYKLAERKARRVSLKLRKKNNQLVQATEQSNQAAPSKVATKKTTSLSATRKGRIIDAQNVLRRNAEAYAERHKN